MVNLQSGKWHSFRCSQRFSHPEQTRPQSCTGQATSSSEPLAREDEVSPPPLQVTLADRAVPTTTSVALGAAETGRPPLLPPLLLTVRRRPWRSPRLQRIFFSTVVENLRREKSMAEEVDESRCFRCRVGGTRGYGEVQNPPVLGTLPSSEECRPPRPPPRELEKSESAVQQQLEHSSVIPAVERSTAEPRGSRWKEGGGEWK